MSQQLLTCVARILVLAIVATEAVSAKAQADGSVESIMTTTIASFALIILTILVVMIYRRVSQRRRDNTFDSAGLDLMRLRNKGLLTPEEMEKVSRSIARRMEEQEAARKKAAARPTPESLLHDPEVRRLQALSEAKEKVDAEQADRQLQTTSDQQRQSAVPADTNNQVEANRPLDPAGETALEDVTLPPEVQQLADAGVLTPEEIENVKRRLLARRHAAE